MKDLLDVEKVYAKQESHTLAHFIFMASFAHLGRLITFVNLIKFVHFLQSCICLLCKKYKFCSVSLF